MWKVRDAFVAIRNTIHKLMPRCCGKASVDEARIPCNGKAPYIQVLKLKPVKQDGDSLCAATAAHLPWGMIRDTVLHIAREHKRVGIPDAMPYQHYQ
eukprot:853480-Ditylum_brightwellii.AAC.3